MSLIVTKDPVDLVWPEDYERKVICGDGLAVLKTMPDDVVQCVVTSPPYWGLRSYLPNRVRLKADVPQEIIRELEQLGIFPLDATEL